MPKIRQIQKMRINALLKRRASRPLLMVLALCIISLVAFVGVRSNHTSSAASTWLSGAAGPEAANGKFGTWRGEAVTIGETWPNTPDLWSLQPGFEWGSWTGPMSVSIDPGANWPGWSSAAAGGHDTFFRQVGQKLKQLRSGKGTTYISPFYEFNGDWMKWSVTRSPQGYTDFKNAWARISNILRQEFPEGKLVLVPACSRDVPAEMMPAASTYDLGGGTIYNEWPFEANGATAMQRLEVCRARAEAAGKPFGITEWSNAGQPRAQSSGGGGEAPAFISAMHSWMSQHAGTGPGQLVFETHFNIGGYEARFEFCTGGSTTCSVNAVQPQTAERYRSLNWGNTGGTTPTPPPTPPTPPPTPPSTPLKVMPLGDSITEGMHNTTPSPDGGYRKILTDRFGTSKIDMVGSLTNNNVGVTDKEHEGHAGYRTDQINANVTNWINTYKPNIVLLHIGTNDYIQNYSGDHMITNVDQTLAKIYAAAPSTKVVLANIVPGWGPPGTWSPPPRTAFNNAVPSLITKYKNQGRDIRFADMVGTGGFFADERDFPDGTHPNLQGYTKMANVWQPHIQAILDGGGTTPTPTPTPPTPPPPTPPPAGAVIINDNTIGTGTNQWQYTGGNWQYYTDGGNKYQGDDHSSSAAGDYATLKFFGTSVEYYGAKSPQAGIVGISIDGGAETMVDLYSATRFDNTLLYSKTGLTNANHTLKIRLTGTKNASATAAAAAVDRAIVVAGTTSTTPGDVNGDNRVNALDLSAIISHDGENYPAGDFNGDGTVGAADLAILLSKWTW